ncbi:putative HVA22-like protein g [Mercurialis annua]|uniref:putative HVA22-like protein g n=1 Tax=Mercurialis annua TaxID=3986 RepID=UPI00215FBBF6|nr:putative HVA22-like protein g [Mercurialis annua]
MIGSFLTRGLVMVFGYAYPAYECYKTVERNKPEIEQLRFWCQYWILVAVLTVCERVGDAFISWVPMYSEAKLAFFIYLWYPKTMGTTYVYDSFFRPYVSKHENEIDRNLLELRTRAGDMAVLYWQRAASYSQTRVLEILQYIAAQSTPRPRPAQTQQQGGGARQPATAPNRQPSNRQPASAQPEIEEPPSPTSSTSSSQQQTDATEEVQEAMAAAAAKALKAPAGVSSVQKIAAVVSTVQKVNATPETSGQPPSTKAEAMQIEAAPSSIDENANPPPKETNMDEAIRVTRARLRKSRSGPKS